jgi:uncharacterized membrane protein
MIRGPATKMQREKESARLERFSDGVFAIAITLFVLSVKVPSHEDAAAAHGLAPLLVALWPAYLAFFSSFVTVLVIWVQHHWIFTQIHRADHPLLYWNGLLLLLVTFVPFPTALLAEHLLQPDAKLAAKLYTGNMLAIALSFSGLWLHVARGGRLLAPATKGSAELRRISTHCRLSPLLYLAAFGLSFISEVTGVAACIFLAFFSAFQGWPMRGR